MSQHWPIIDGLLGGTSAMRGAARNFLPIWPNEEQASYDSRLGTATLFPALSRTMSVMSGKPFAKQITLGDDVPENIREWCDDVDQQGNNLHSFSVDVLFEALGYGLCGVLVDYPTITPDVKTQRDEQSLGVRPYAVFIRHNQILGWKSERIAGVMRLTQLRLAEEVEVDDGGFGTVRVKRVRVLTPGAYEVWEENEKAEYILVAGGTTTLNVIPFVPFYGKKMGFMCGKSPLLDLAYLNVKHWQSQSDQDTILHVARVPILAMIGADEGVLTVGASTAVRLPLGAELKFVEHSGAAIAAGEVALEKLEDQMITTGAELLVIKPGEQKSATQSNNEAEANKSDLQRIVESFEDSLDQVLQLMADWVNAEQGGHASLFKDFGAATLTDASAQLILSMQQQGLITKETAIREQQRRGMLAADIVPEDELSDVALEGPALGEMGVDPITGLPVEPALGGNVATETPPATGNVATQQPVDNSPQGGNVATPAPAPAPDFSAITDAIAALVAKIDTKPEAVPFDLSAVVDAINAKQIAPAPDNTATLQALVEAIRNMPAPVVNMPDISVTPAPITVEAPTINMPAPAPVPVPERKGPLQIKFDLDAEGMVIGASEVGPGGRSIQFETNGDGNPTGARMN